MTFLKRVLLFVIMVTSFSGFAQITGDAKFAMDSIDWAKPKEYYIAGIQIECSQFTDKKVKEKILSLVNQL